MGPTPICHTQLQWGNESPYKDISSPYKDESSLYKGASAPGGIPSPSHAESWPKCGSTPAEAKSLGCKFDILSFAWQLPACYDEKIMDEFLAEKDWVFYREPNGTSPVSRDVALQRELDLFVTQEYRRTHCMYTWRQMHRAFTIQKHIDSHLNDYYHTLHCHHVMLGEQIPADAVGAVGTVKYPACQ
ncbi:hypothetical protein BM1_07295 [Bipolaris maydis]|nr:hypothetical protein BM1_07295 [Bipolaris maydis]KAJ6280145.1 hypothetical protein J3E71DRAFT_242800 [Bipolaris maydis]